MSQCHSICIDSYTHDSYVTYVYLQKEQQLQLIHFAGRIVALALRYQVPVGVQLAGFFWTLLADEPPSFAQLEEVQPDLYG